MSENSRIAKNTLYMYIRMGISMFVGLYTSRVVLHVLGVEDYGLYNVIGGIIALFTVLNNALVNTTSRFITISLAKDSHKVSRQIFNMTLLMHFCVGVFIVVVGESVGLWYLHEKLVIPAGRGHAAEWLYQFTVVAAFLSTVNVPYNASIIAHEKINVYAILQIIDTFLNLGIVIILQFVSFDKLVFYGALMFLVKVFNFGVNYIYCYRKFQEVKFLFYWSWERFKEMLNFVGWAIIGNFSAMFFTQGVNLMLNAFCGPAVNAARGIAVQVQSVVAQLANNIQTAINPQIIKNYAINNLMRMHMLICSSTRYCFYLLLIFILPLELEADFVLKLWLGIVPDHTVNFVRMILVVVLLESYVNPMFTANIASGKLKIYYLSVSIISFSFMFITFYALKITNIPESVFFCFIIQKVIGIVVRVFVMWKQVGLTPKEYLSKAISPTFLVAIISIIIPLVFHILLYNELQRFFIVLLISLSSTSIAIYRLGLTKEERLFAFTFVKTKLSAVLKKGNVKQLN